MRAPALQFVAQSTDASKVPPVAGAPSDIATQQQTDHHAGRKHRGTAHTEVMAVGCAGKARQVEPWTLIRFQSARRALPIVHQSLFG